MVTFMWVSFSWRVYLCALHDVPTAAGIDVSADIESCTWVYKDQQGRINRDVEFALGLNMPFMFAARVGECTAAG